MPLRPELCGRAVRRRVDAGLNVFGQGWTRCAVRSLVCDDPERFPAGIPGVVYVDGQSWPVATGTSVVSVSRALVGSAARFRTPRIVTVRPTTSPVTTPTDGPTCSPRTRMP